MNLAIENKKRLLIYGFFFAKKINKEKKRKENPLQRSQTRISCEKTVACFIFLYLFIGKQSFKILTAVSGSLQ